VIFAAPAQQAFSTPMSFRTYSLGLIARLWSFAARMCPLQFPRGVHKYRSIEANADRDRWEEANFRAFHERRRANRGSP
jgi:hypothetical protein